MCCLQLHYALNFIPLSKLILFKKLRIVHSYHISHIPALCMKNKRSGELCVQILKGIVASTESEPEE